MRWFCWFALCRWRYIGNVIMPGELAMLDHTAGLYQCTRCKTLSLGSPTDPAKRQQQ